MGPYDADMEFPHKNVDKDTNLDFAKKQLRQSKEKDRGNKKEPNKDVTANKQTQQRLCTFRSLQGERAWERNGLDYYRTEEHRHSTTLREGATRRSLVRIQIKRSS